MDSLVDPKMGEFNREAMAMFIQVAFMCLERLGKNRPDMEEVCRRLNEVREEMRGVRDSKESTWRSASAATTTDVDSVAATYAGDSSSVPMSSYGTGSSFSQMSTILGGR